MPDAGLMMNRQQSSTERDVHAMIGGTQTIAEIRKVGRSVKVSASERGSQGVNPEDRKRDELTEWG